MLCGKRLNRMETTNLGAARVVRIPVEVEYAHDIEEIKK